MATAVSACGILPLFQSVNDWTDFKPEAKAISLRENPFAARHLSIRPTISLPFTLTNHFSEKKGKKIRNSLIFFLTNQDKLVIVEISSGIPDNSTERVEPPAVHGEERKRV
jgi:hypothetical protein